MHGADRHCVQVAALQDWQTHRMLSVGWDLHFRQEVMTPSARAVRSEARCEKDQPLVQRVHCKPRSDVAAGGGVGAGEAN